MNTFLAKKFVEYRLKAGDEHSLHSPFVFDLYCNVIRNRDNYYAYSELAEMRKQLQENNNELKVEELGAGSRHFKNARRTVKDIARHGITSEKYARLLFRLADHFKCETLIELGTSIGLNAMYLAAAAYKSRVITLEGSAELCTFARNLYTANHVRNIELVQGNFDDTFETVIAPLRKIDLLFIDGNHRKAPTLHYFSSALGKMHNNSLVVLDDIHWSEDMEEAWKTVQAHPQVTVTIDLFQFGLVFFRREHKEKEHFVLKF